MDISLIITFASKNKRIDRKVAADIVDQMARARPKAQTSATVGKIETLSGPLESEEHDSCIRIVSE